MKTPARRLYLRTRQALHLPPLPEEMTGIVAPDPYDSRDHLKPALVGSAHEPRTFSLLAGTGVRANHQGRVNSCSGHAAAKSIEILTSRMPSGRIVFSPMWSYWHNRLESGSDPFTQDGGAYVRSTMAALKRHGLAKVGPAFDRPFDPPPRHADVFRIRSYERIPVGLDAPNQVKRILYQERLAILAGVRTYRSNNQRRDGQWLCPPPSEMWEGGHAVLFVGYSPDIFGDEAEDRFYFLNSWGESWGHNGIGSVPARFLTDNAFTFDLWTLTPDYF